MTGLYIESIGDSNGQDLVFLHGWAMHSGIWQEVSASLGQHARVHLIDLPGHGESAIDQSGTLQHWVDTVGKILPPHCIVVGWSLGGQIADGIGVAISESCAQISFDCYHALFYKKSRMAIRCRA